MNSPKAIIFSSNSEISQKIHDTLSKKGIFVKEFCLNRNSLQENNFFNFNLGRLDYLFVVNLPPLGFKKKERLSKKLFLSLFRVAKRTGCKLIFILPYFQRKNDQLLSEYLNDLSKNKKIFLKQVFVGEIYKESKLLHENGLLFFVSKNSTRLKLKKEEEYYLPIEIGDFAESLVNHVFSLNSSNNSSFLSKPLSFLKFKVLLEKAEIINKVKFIEKSKPLFKSPFVFNKIFLNTNQKDVLKLLFEINKKRPQTKKDFNKNLFLKRSLIIFLILIFLPFVLFFSSTLFFFTSKFFEKRGYLEISQKTASFAKFTNFLIEKYVYRFSNLPLFEYHNRCIRSVFFINSRELDIWLKKIKFEKKAVNLFLNIFYYNNGVDESYLNETVLDLDELIKDIAIYEAELQEKTCGSFSSKNFFNKKNYNQESLVYLRNVFKDTRNFLGFDSPKTYAFILQDEMFIRPGGGIIKAIFLFNFSQGKIEIVDARTASEIDKSMKGQIEPPGDLKNFLNTNILLFKDSNWYSDFASNSKIASKFIEKSLGLELDGLVAINLNFFEKIIKTAKIDNETGELVKFISFLKEKNLFRENYLPNINNSLSEKNKLLKKSFFPEKLFSFRKMKVIRLVYQGLMSKDIQVFLKDDDLNLNLQRLGLGNSINKINCVINCYHDYIKIIEAQNEAEIQAETKRKAQLEIFIGESVIKRKLLFKVRKENPEQEGGYLNYLRVVVPEDVSFGLVTINSDELIKEIKPNVFGYLGNKEGSLLTEIPFNKEVLLNFVWESSVDIDFDKKGQYNLSVFKQPGVEDYDFSVTIKTEGDNLNYDFKNFDLTGRNEFGYNITLTRDILSRLSWENANSN